MNIYVDVLHTFFDLCSLDLYFWKSVLLMIMDWFPLSRRELAIWVYSTYGSVSLYIRLRCDNGITDSWGTFITETRDVFQGEAIMFNHSVFKHLTYCLTFSGFAVFDSFFLFFAQCQCSRWLLFNRGRWNIWRVRIHISGVRIHIWRVRIHIWGVSLFRGRRLDVPGVQGWVDWSWQLLCWEVITFVPQNKNVI